MRGVYQRETDDCGIAALATLTGVSYTAALAAVFRLEALVGLCRRRLLTKTSDLARGARNLGRPLDGKRLRQVQSWRSIPTPALVKVPHPDGSKNWHWVVKLNDRFAWCPNFGKIPAQRLRATSALGLAP